MNRKQLTTPPFDTFIEKSFRIVIQIHCNLLYTFPATLEPVQAEEAGRRRKQH